MLASWSDVSQTFDDNLLRSGIRLSAKERAMSNLRGFNDREGVGVRKQLYDVIRQRSYIILYPDDQSNVHASLHSNIEFCVKKSRRGLREGIHTLFNSAIARKNNF